MNYFLNLFIIIGLCWKFSFSLEKIEHNSEITCGQLKANPRVESLMYFKHLKVDATTRFPWTVYMLKKDSRQNENKFKEDDYYDYDYFEYNLLCKGFLIHPRVVVITASCIQKVPLENIEIRNGAWIPPLIRPLVSASSSLFYEQTRYVSNMTIHPDYDLCTKGNNHALLLLDKGFDMSKPDIGVLCLSNAEMMTLQCEDVFNVYSTDVPANNLCQMDDYLDTQEKYLVCPMDPQNSNQYYYSGLYRYAVLSSTEQKNSVHDKFTGNIDWVQSFLNENNVNDTLYTI